MKDNKKGEGDFLYKKKRIKEKLERIKRLTFFVQKYKDNTDLILDYMTEIERTSGEIELLLEGIADSEPNEKEKKEEKERCLKKKNILLAIPEGQREEQLMDILRKVEVTVFWVTEGKKAVDAYLFSRSKTFDAVLLDVHVPNKNGFLVAKAIRSSGKSDATWIPLIALLDRENQEDVRRAREAGMDGWIKEPFCEEDVIAAIFNFIQKVSLNAGVQSV